MATAVTILKAERPADAKLQSLEQILGEVRTELSCQTKIETGGLGAVVLSPHCGVVCSFKRGLRAGVSTFPDPPD